MNETKPDNKLWYVLLGAMLVNRQIRHDIAAKLTTEDVPRELSSVWDCVTKGDQAGARQIFSSWKVDVWDDGVIPSVTRHLQELAMGELCQKMMSTAAFTRLQTPEELRDKFVKMASVMDSRIASLAASKEAAREEIRKQKEKAAAPLPSG